VLLTASIHYLHLKTYFDTASRNALEKPYYNHPTV
jgi:hypothetical protein